MYVYLVQSSSQKKNHKIEIYYRGKLKPPKQTADVIPSGQVEFDNRIGVINTNKDKIICFFFFIFHFAFVGCINHI